MRTQERAAHRHKLEGPEQFMVWASRHYLWSAIRSIPAPPFVFEAFENAGIDVLYYALDRVLVCLLAAPTGEIIVHDARCPCVALHEQALLMALARLQCNDDAGFSAAMSAIMLPTAVKVSEPPMKLLAAGLLQMKSEQRMWVRTYDEGSDRIMRQHYGACSRRTIN